MAVQDLYKSCKNEVYAFRKEVLLFEFEKGDGTIQNLIDEARPEFEKVKTRRDWSSRKLRLAGLECQASTVAQSDVIPATDREEVVAAILDETDEEEETLAQLGAEYDQNVEHIQEEEEYAPTVEAQALAMESASDLNEWLTAGLCDSACTGYVAQHYRPDWVQDGFWALFAATTDEKPQELHSARGARDLPQRRRQTGLPPPSRTQSSSFGVIM